MYLYKTPTEEHPNHKIRPLSWLQLLYTHNTRLRRQSCFLQIFFLGNKTPKRKPRLKNHQNQKALLPEGASDSLHVCISSCCFHTAKATASLQAWDWPLCARGFKGHCGQRDCTGGSPSGVRPAFPSPPAQWPQVPSLLPCRWCVPAE